MQHFLIFHKNKSQKKFTSISELYDIIIATTTEVLKYLETP